MSGEDRPTGKQDADLVREGVDRLNSAIVAEYPGYPTPDDETLLSRLSDLANRLERQIRVTTTINPEEWRGVSADLSDTPPAHGTPS